MIFRKTQWQKVVREKISRYKIYSYGKLADLLKHSKSQAWKMVNYEHCWVSVEDFLLICRYVEINPLDYIVKDEVQLKLI